jgi:hypothetical protein
MGQNVSIKASIEFNASKKDFADFDIPLRTEWVWSIGILYLCATFAS